LKDNAVLVHEGVDIVKQFYLAVVLDRTSQGPAFIVSKNGGMEIEEVAKTHPDSIVVEPIDIKSGVTDKQAEKLCKVLELEPKQYKDATE